MIPIRLTCVPLPGGLSAGACSQTPAVHGASASLSTMGQPDPPRAVSGLSLARCLSALEGARARQWRATNAMES